MLTRLKNTAPRALPGRGADTFMRSLTLVVLLAAGCGAPAGSREAPEFELRDMSGKAVRLSALRGRPVLVNFWATWCESCREEMPALEALHRRYPEASLLGVSLDAEPAKEVPPFAKAHGLTFPLLAGTPAAAAAFGVRGLPTAFLIDQDGRIARRWAGAVDAAAVENDIKALLKRRPS